MLILAMLGVAGTVGAAPVEKAPPADQWKPVGQATLQALEPAAMHGRRVRTQRRGSPNRTAGVLMPIGAVQTGDLLRVRLTYQVVSGGPIQLHVGPSPLLGLVGLNATDKTSLTADFPVRQGGTWNLWIQQPMSRPQGEFVVYDLSVQVAEQGPPDRFPVVIDGDMEQDHTGFYGPYHAVRLQKVTDPVRSGKRSLRVRSEETDRPTSLYAGVAASIGQLPAQARVHVAFDIQVLQGTIAPYMARGAFDRSYAPIGPGDWRHVEFDYETPYDGWYTIYWTRQADIAIDFLLDNVVVTVQKRGEEKTP